MKIIKGQRVKINGDIYVVAQLFQSGKIITTTGEEFFADWDIVERV